MDSRRRKRKKLANGSTQSSDEIFFAPVHNETSISGDLSRLMNAAKLPTMVSTGTQTSGPAFSIVTSSSRQNADLSFNGFNKAENLWIENRLRDLYDIEGELAGRLDKCRNEITHLSQQLEKARKPNLHFYVANTAKVLDLKSHLRFFLLLLPPRTWQSLHHLLESATDVIARTVDVIQAILQPSFNDLVHEFLNEFTNANGEKMQMGGSPLLSSIDKMLLIHKLEDPNDPRLIWLKVLMALLNFKPAETAVLESAHTNQIHESLQYMQGISSLDPKYLVQISQFDVSILKRFRDLRALSSQLADQKPDIMINFNFADELATSIESLIKDMTETGSNVHQDSIWAHWSILINILKGKPMGT